MRSKVTEMSLHLCATTLVDYLCEFEATIKKALNCVSGTQEKLFEVKNLMSGPLHIPQIRRFLRFLIPFNFYHSKHSFLKLSEGVHSRLYYVCLEYHVSVPEELQYLRSACTVQ
jgi:hypothetical protein